MVIEILHVCPANCTTGGPEAIHEFVHELNKKDNVHARIWYWGIKSYPPQPEEYKSYGCEYVTELPENYSGVIIVPEIWANRVIEYKNCIRAIYWLGIDAYAGWTPEGERGAFLEDEDIIHIAQSDYAEYFLKKLGVKHIVKCIDLLNPDFYEEYEEEERNNAVLYNPAKSTPFMHELMAACSGIEWKQIRGMTRAEVIDTMRHAKLYVDFGEFPGRERIPREAVLCGCCIITSKIGSANYLWDFPHIYKYDSKPEHIWAIIRKMRQMLDNYEKYSEGFKYFKERLKAERGLLQQEITDVVKEFERAYEVQHNHSGT